jgi:hypothetical protein
LKTDQTLKFPCLVQFWRFGFLVQVHVHDTMDIRYTMPRGQHLTNDMSHRVSHLEINSQAKYTYTLKGFERVLRVFSFGVQRSTQLSVTKNTLSCAIDLTCSTLN